MLTQGTLSPELAFRRYEDVRGRLPQTSFPAGSIRCGGLLEITDQFDAFLLDGFGVLNVGARAISGAPECLAALRDQGKRLIVLTNAASAPVDQIVEKYAALGFAFDAEEIVTSRMAAAARLGEICPGGLWGAIAAPGDRFEDIPARVEHWSGQAVDAYLFLSSAGVTAQLIDKLRAALESEPRPLVVANPDLVAPQENGLSKEPGYYGHLLGDLTPVRPVFFGKPFAEVFDDALGRLGGIDRARVAMVGDTLHTDILGGQVAGLQTVLVRAHGLFAGMNVTRYVQHSGIVPTFECPRI